MSLDLDGAADRAREAREQHAQVRQAERQQQIQAFDALRPQVESLGREAAAALLAAGVPLEKLELPVVRADDVTDELVYSRHREMKVWRLRSQPGRGSSPIARYVTTDGVLIPRDDVRIWADRPLPDGLWRNYGLVIGRDGQVGKPYSTWADSGRGLGPEQSGGGVERLADDLSTWVMLTIEIAAQEGVTRPQPVSPAPARRSLLSRLFG